MNPLILFALTLAATAQAQQLAPCLKLSKVETETHVLHRSSGTDVKLTFAGQHCYVLSDPPSLGPLRPVVEMQSEPGLFVTTESPELSGFDQTALNTSILKAEEVSVTFTWQPHQSWRWANIRFQALFVIGLSTGWETSRTKR
jgi:hypothetical protein